MIYTSYFAKGRLLKAEGIVGVSIAFYKPKYWHGFEYRKLAPTPEILNYYRKWHDTASYKQQFRADILSQLNPRGVVKELKTLIGEKGDIALLCYEMSTAFCHRHIVADWLNLHGIPCEEFKGGWK